MIASLVKLVLALALLLAPGVLQAQTQIEVSVTLDNSLNNNTVYVGDMTTAWQYQSTYEHTYDHQLAFGTAFQNANGTFYIPIGNTHLEQANTGISAGEYAGAAVGANLVNMGGSQVTGMFVFNANLGAVATNQAVLNSLVTFAAP